MRACSISDFFFPASEIAMIVPMAAAAGAVYVEVDSML
jgi:ApbE superfamily uncharacterized protein (UPF0280 family)